MRRLAFSARIEPPGKFDSGSCTSNYLACAITDSIDALQERPKRDAHRALWPYLNSAVGPNSRCLWETLSWLKLLAKKIPCPPAGSLFLRSVRIATGGVVFVLCLILGIVSETIAADDVYIAGYAAAVLRHEFEATKASLHVQGGVVMVNAESLGTVDRTKVKTALEGIPGVVRVEIQEGQAHTDVREPVPIPQEPRQARVKIPSSRSPRGSVPCRPAMAAFLHSVPSSYIRAGAGAIPARPILVKRLHSIVTRLLSMANGKSRSRPESSVYSI